MKSEKQITDHRATESPEREAGPTFRLPHIYAPIRSELEKVRERIKSEALSVKGVNSFSVTTNGYLSAVTQHMINSPGKLIRPALVILSAQVFGEPPEADQDVIICLASAVEFFHMASLAHDDIIDREQYRRDSITLNNKYGDYVAVLAGDIFYAKFFALLTSIVRQRSGQNLELLTTFCDLTERMCVAEIGEQHFAKSRSCAEPDEYLTTLKYKTADLMAACCEGAAVLRGASATQRENLSRFGSAFGMAFQLYDDIRDQDAIVREDMDTHSEASAFAVEALDTLALLPPSEARTILEKMCRFISQP